MYNFSIMKKVLCVVILVIIIFKIPGKTQSQLNTSATLVYAGGPDSLSKHIWKKIRSKINIQSDHLLFFKIAVSSTGIENVSTLFIVDSEVSGIVKKAIKETDAGWVRQKNLFEVVVPIFLITEQQKDSKKPVTYNSFNRNEQPVSCLLFPPIVFNFYEKNH